MERLSNSGYHACPCRDCLEIAIGCDDDNTPHLCHSCETAGCDPEVSSSYGTNESECQAPHAYCAGDSRYSDPDVMIDGVAYCPVCGSPF